MRRGEGRGGCRPLGERYIAVPANVLQQSCRAPGLQMHRWGCWLAAPLLGRAAARVGLIPASPRARRHGPG